MDQNPEQAPEAAAPETKVETPAVEEVKPETIGQVLEEKGEKDGRMVPEAAFLELKKSNKELKRDLTALQRSIESGASQEEVSQDIDAIAEEFNVDKKFLKKVAAVIRKDADADAEEKLQSRLKPLQEQERASKIDKIFNTHFDAAMGDMPEFAEVVNKSVIKTLSLDPGNANKTFAQLIQETYGSSIRGKRTLETTTPRGGKSPDGIDFDRAAKDQNYLKEVMSDPELKKEYNERLTDRLSANL